MNYLSSFNVTQYRLNSKVAFVSAFFYCLAFIDLARFFWCIIPALLFFMRSIYACDSVGVAVKRALQWGCMVYGLHCASVVYSLFIMRPHYGLLVWWMIATIYLASYTIVLFVLCVGVRVLGAKRIIARSLLTCCLVVAYFWLVESHAFWIFGVRGGCCLVSPLIPLSRFFLNNSAPAASYIGIVRTPYVPLQHVEPAAWVRNFFKLVAHEREKNSDILCIITPESALPFALNKHTELLRIFCDYSRMMPLLIGSFFEDCQAVSNCFYYFCEGKLSQRYVKQHLMPCIEVMPSWCNNEFLCLFFNTNAVAFQKKPKHVPMRRCMYVKDVALYPIICSELFCDSILSGVSDTEYVVALVNDAWFSYSFCAECAFVYAQVQAWWYGKKIIYVSFFKDGCL